MNAENLPQLVTSESDVFLPQDKERIAGYLDNAKAANTKKAYQSDWADFEHWCAGRGFAPLPATSACVALYLTKLAARCKVSTVKRRLVSINQAHTATGFTPPTASYGVRETMKRIRRTHAPS